MALPLGLVINITGSYTVPGATVFSNSNNVSFGLNGSTITATATVATSLTNIRISAGNEYFVQQHQHRSATSHSLNGFAQCLCLCGDKPHNIQISAYTEHLVQ
jgi:hypothetical protein